MREDTKILKLFYTFFLGLLLAIFIGVGINTFYEGPQAPEYPTALNSVGKNGELTPEQVAIQKQWDQDTAQYDEAMKPYNRTVSMLALGAAVVFLAVSMVFEKRIKLMADGVMLGGLFSLIYSLARGFASDNSKYVFAMVSISLVIVLYLGFHRFVRIDAAQKAA